MKHLIIFLLTLISFTASAQITNNTAWYKFAQKLTVGNKLQVPNDTATLTAQDTGLIAIKNGQFFYAGVIGGSLQWSEITGGGGGGGGGAVWGGITGDPSDQADLQALLNAKQATLVSGTNIKTINGTTLLGSGDLVIGGGDILNGGNTTGATVVIGTNDAQGLAFETGGITYLTLNSSGVLTHDISSALTATPVDHTVYNVSSTGTVANGFGHTVSFYGESTTTLNRQMSQFETNWTNATDASRNAHFYIKTYNNGALNTSVRFGAGNFVSTDQSMFIEGGEYYKNRVQFASGNASINATGGTITLFTSTSAGGVSLGTNSLTSTTLNRASIAAGESYAAASGTGTYTAFKAQNTFNLTGTASGVQRGFHSLITITSLGSATYRGVDLDYSNASAWGVYQSGVLSPNAFAGSTIFGDVTTPAATALVEFKSTTKGVLFPRMDGTQRDAISSPPDGMVIYNTSTSKLEVRAGGAWVALH